MESVFGRYRNLIILVFALFVQVIALGVQVRRTTDPEPTRLIRVWVVSAVTPLEKAIVWVQSGSVALWHNYFYLRGVRQENRDLKAEIQQLRLEQVRLSQDAQQARRLQALLGFKEQYLSRSIAAQVIGSSGSEQSRSIFIDKGSDDGVKNGMAVITADGIVGRTTQHVLPTTAEVLLINDQSSGVGALLEKSRLQGVLKGTPAGEVILEKVMVDESVQEGEPIVTSGGDRIFPKGLPVGVVTKVSPGQELFLNIRVKPAANLSKLEEVLVVSTVEEKPVVDQAGSARAVDILADRLPSVPPKPPADASKTASTTANATPGRATGATPPPPDANASAGKPPSPAKAQAPAATSGAAVPHAAGAAATIPSNAAAGASAGNAPKTSNASPPAKEPANSGTPLVKPASTQKPPLRLPAAPGGNANPPAIKPAADKPKPPPSTEPVSPETPPQ